MISRFGELSALWVVGDVALDHYIEVEHDDIAAFEKLTASGSQWLLGGTACNVATLARRMGSPLSMHSLVGDDFSGVWLLAELAKTGLDVSNIDVISGRSTTATVIRGPSSRTVIVDLGVSDDVGRVCWHEPPTDVLVYVSNTPAALVRLVDEDAGERTIVGFDSWMAQSPGLLQALEQCALIVTNTEGWVTLEHRAVHLPTVIETRGGEGAVIHTRGERTVDIPPFPADVVDSTGAGDAFSGALCHYLLGGEQLSEACAAACEVAASATTVVGTQGFPIPPLAERS